MRSGCLVEVATVPMYRTVPQFVFASVTRFPISNWDFAISKPVPSYYFYFLFKKNAALSLHVFVIFANLFWKSAKSMDVMSMADKNIVHSEEHLQWSDSEDDTNKSIEKFKFGVTSASKNITKVSVPFRLSLTLVNTDFSHENYSYFCVYMHCTVSVRPNFQQRDNPVHFSCQKTMSIRQMKTLNLKFHFYSQTYANGLVIFTNNLKFHTELREQ